MSGVRVAFKQSEGVFDGVDQKPIEVKQVPPGTPRQDDSCHGSATSSALGELAAEILERDGIVACQLGQAGFDRGERR